MSSKPEASVPEDDLPWVLAEAAYLGFCRRLGHAPVDWERLSHKRRQAWREAAFCVRRQLEEIADVAE